MPERFEHRLLELHDHADQQEQDDAEHQRQADAELAGELGLFPRQPRHQHGDEHDIVDAQNDLHDRQGGKGNPHIRISQQFKHRALRSTSRRVGTI
ncbi:hypothetical protein D3C87_1308320 [compost metagenome]